MKRKLVKQGVATLMISLPSKWIKKFSLKKGDEISLEELDNKLIITRDKVSSKKQIELNIKNNTESAIRTFIVNTYRTGFDKIKINFRDEKQYKIITNTINDYLIGFEVIEKEKDFCILENITEPSEEQFEILFRKILYNIDLLIRNTEERLKGKKEFSEYKEIVLRVHQYDNFCRRVISKTNILGNKSNLFWTFLTLLIHGQRELYHLNIFLDKNKIKFKEFDFFENLKVIFSLLNKSYIEKDLSKIERIHELEKDMIYKEFYSKIQKNSKDNIVLYHLASSLRNFYLATSPLMVFLSKDN